MNNELVFFDSLKGEKIKFSPVDKNNIRVYACGPTVYDFAHIGNARMAVSCDVLIRILRLIYKKVTFVSNITDIDDKIIKKSLELKKPIWEITKKFQKIYNQDMKNLGVKHPDIQPKATDYITNIIKAINDLLKTKNAYVYQGHVLFHVPSYSHYGNLSKRTIEEQIAGNRVDVAPFKKNKSDFVLWKPSKSNEPSWNSPWGPGRPGWHIECTVMSQKTLGLPFDIHCGGVDLKFPHHENEIAQSCSLVGKDTEPEKFSKYWFHNGFVQINDKKMSKSLGNYKLICNLLREYSGDCVKFALLSSHYRQPLNWTEKILDQAKKNINRLNQLNEDTKDTKISREEEIKFTDDIRKTLLDDINTPNAFGILNKISKKFSKKDLMLRKIMKANLNFIKKTLGLFCKDSNNTRSIKIGDLKNKKIEKLIEERNDARSKKDYKKADQLRDKLKELGIDLNDSKNKTIWKRN